MDFGVSWWKCSNSKDTNLKILKVGFKSKEKIAKFGQFGRIISALCFSLNYFVKKNDVPLIEHRNHLHFIILFYHIIFVIQ